jgi:hypothetical protein
VQPRNISTLNDNMAKSSAPYLTVGICCVLVLYLVRCAYPGVESRVILFVRPVNSQFVRQIGFERWFPPESSFSVLPWWPRLRTYNVVAFLQQRAGHKCPMSNMPQEGIKEFLRNDDSSNAEFSTSNRSESFMVQKLSHKKMKLLIGIGLAFAFAKAHESK